MEKLKISLNEVQSPQCQYFVVRKKRLCRMTVRPGRQYCGEHEPEPKLDDGQADTRIPCPNDPKHTCYISKLQKHLSICNARQGELPPYIVKGINAGSSSEGCPRPLLSEVPKEMMEQLVEKVNRLYDKYVKDNISTVEEQPIHPIVLEDYEQGDRTESSRRHLQQASSLLRLAEQEGLVRDRTCYVELGAGKGHMSYYAWRAWCEPVSRASGVLLVDRASLRHKRDNKLRDVAYTSARNQAQEASTEDTLLPTDNSQNRTVSSSSETTATREELPDKSIPESSNGTSHVFKHKADLAKTTNGEVYANANAETSSTEAPIRLRADLADLALEKVPVVQECDGVVGFAKHLCGAATDFALRCITSEGLGDKTQGVVIATCCHHRCDPNSFFGLQHLYEMGITAEELGVLLGVVSWATCGDGRSRQRRLQDDQAANGQGEGEVLETKGYKLPQAVRESVGRRAKALLDWSRARRLRALGLPAALRRYVPAAASPENIAIVAVRRAR
ncbi:tRNA:m(4)X modification enzyme TRM13 [Ostrinia furnacalis]|uniref:tRNA:m(4)X modification enzyme TRM13 n=1 Tax=Ostrinia furnacalis TaxID=93504 RepID=UPI00103DCC0B|nr:tRNA:m(4)X modification enzyme TRM13 [Ostrinia furnacalis]